MIFGYNRHFVVLNLFQHPRINLEIPKQVRNDRDVRNSMERNFIFMVMTMDRFPHLRYGYIVITFRLSEIKVVEPSVIASGAKKSQE